jgi:SAM-dependent methyltransferase
MGLAGEMVRHPWITMKFVVRRIGEIPKKGLPKLRREANDDFDTRYGVETSSMSWVTPTVGSSYMHGTRYNPTSERSVRWAIETAGLPLEQTCFVDVGCGKGRPLIIANEYPFRRIVGVEYAPELAEVARRNLAKVDKLDRCSVVCTDASIYEFPDGALLTFLYNPFDWVIYEKVLANLAKATGPVRHVHCGPGNDAIVTSGLMKVLADGPDGACLYEFARP